MSFIFILTGWLLLDLALGKLREIFETDGWYFSLEFHHTAILTFPPEARQQGEQMMPGQFPTDEQKPEMPNIECSPGGSLQVPTVSLPQVQKIVIPGFSSPLTFLPTVEVGIKPKAVSRTHPMCSWSRKCTRKGLRSNGPAKEPSGVRTGSRTKYRIKSHVEVPLVAPQPVSIIQGKMLQKLAQQDPRESAAVCSRRAGLESSVQISNINAVALMPKSSDRLLPPSPVTDDGVDEGDQFGSPTLPQPCETFVPTHPSH
ncbi:hypothetical protein BDZ91DRAFT_752969 [Kalaharituber pfeilii]|nr:hypothetical protein BDZ91DRAFT_752969 [Kalaharituber pfeilii]